MDWSQFRKTFLADCKVIQSPISERRRLLLRFALVVLMYTSSAQAQTGEWQAVQNLRPGTLLSIKASHRVKCIFQGATQNELTCQRFYREIRVPSAQIVLDRQSIREVRLERSDEANGTVAAMIGAGAGAAAGASTGNGTSSREGRSLLIGGIGAIAGWFFGRDFHILQGKIIYKK